MKSPKPKPKAKLCHVFTREQRLPLALLVLRIWADPDYLRTPEGVAAAKRFENVLVLPQRLNAFPPAMQFIVDLRGVLNGKY